MTVATTASFVEYAADGVQTAFTVNYPFLAASDLIVFTQTAAGVPTLKVITTDYTVTGGGGSTGTVTFLAAPASGLTVRIFRWVPFTQGVDLVENDRFPAETIERSLDRLTMLCQQLAGRVGGSDFSIAGVLTVQLTANNQLQWDALNKKIVNLADPTGAQDAVTKAYADNLVVSSGNVPAPLAADINKVLTATGANTFTWVVSAATLVPTPANPGDDTKHISASGGVYVIRTAAQSRTDLGLGTAATLNVGTGANNIVQLDGTAKLPAVNGSQLTNLPGSNPAVNAHVILLDQKASATEGGTFTSGAWQTRTLQTEQSDTGGLASIAANQITLAAGTYYADIICPAYRVERNQARLRNITDATTLLVGTTGDLKAGERDSSYSHIRGVFTIAATKVLEVQHQCSTTRNTEGFGKAAGFGENEIYTVVLLTKLA